MPLLCALCVLWAAAAPAGERLVVLSAVRGAPDADAVDTVSSAEVLQSVAELALGMAAVDRAEVAGSELEHRVRGCGADNACVSQALRKAELRYALTFAANLGAEPYLATLSLLDARQGRTLGRQVFEIPLARRPGLELLRRRALELLAAAGVAVGARLLVDATPADAQIYADGAALPVPRAGVVLPAGRHQLLVRRDGYEDRAMPAEVAPGQELKLSVELVAEGSLTSSPWFWAAVVGGVVLASAGAIALFTAPAPPLHACQTRDPAAGCP